MDKIKLLFQNTLALLRRYPELPGRFHALRHDLAHDYRTRFLAFSWSLVAIFAGMAILTESNPFTLLIPGLTYPFPSRDRRTSVKIYGISRETGKPQSLTHSILLEHNPARDAMRVAFTLTHTVGYREGEDYREYHNLDSLPDLAFAIRHIWIRDVKGRKEMILDLRAETIQEEVVSFMKNRNYPGRDSNYYLDRYFQALTLSLFSAEPDIESIRYALDGQPGTIPGITFPLNQRLDRATFMAGF